ncbi:hypothetical protein D3C72_1956690 [compost metagenome]
MPVDKARLLQRVALAWSGGYGADRAAAAHTQTSVTLPPRLGKRGCPNRSPSAPGDAGNCRRGKCRHPDWPLWSGIIRLPLYSEPVVQALHDPDEWHAPDTSGYLPVNVHTARPPGVDRSRPGSR